MIPVIASSGRSFKGAFAYYMHDKNAQTTKRIVWTETLNMMTQCVEKAHKVMAYTAKAQSYLKEATGQKRTGRKLEKPVFAYSLSWHPEQKPDKAEMLKAAKTSLAKLGLTEHEVAIAAHSDEPHAHCHIIVNRVHPLTGMAANMKYSKRRLSDFARKYEREHRKIYCKKREENHRKRQQGERTRYNDPIIAEAWQRSTNAEGFQYRLAAKGYQLAQGRKRLVVIDPHGKTHNPTRHLKGIAKAAEFNRRMGSLDQTKLPTVESVTAERRVKEKQYQERVEAFEKRAAQAISKTTAKHYQQQNDLLIRHHRKLTSKRTELADYYQLEEKQERIDDLKHRIKHPNFMQKLSFKLFRTDQKLKDSISQIKATKATAEQRMSEALTQLERNRDRELDGLKKRQARELETITNNLEGWRPKQPSLTQEWQRANRERQHTRERSHDAPSYSR